jgi:F420-dependent oxidoreductase-like protein
MRLGVNLGYWGAGNDAENLHLAREADTLGYAVAWAAEAYGSDAATVLAWVAAQTTQIDVGSAIFQIPGRTPALTAMTAATLDNLSGGRFRLGLGVSGPQVSEGWHGVRFDKPLARTREYVEIIRKVLAREEPLEYDGEFYQHPYHGPDSTGLGKPLRSITHPLRREIPIYLGAEGPKNVTMTAEIADGWIPLYYSPFRQEVYAEQLAGAKEGFEIPAMCNLNICDDVETGLMPVKMMLGFYIGGMGAKGKNFHTDLMARMGFEEEAHRIQDLFFEGRRDEAIAMVPTEFADEISLVGPPGRIKERLEAWKDSPVTTLTMYPSSPEMLRQAAEIILGS